MHHVADDTLYDDLVDRVKLSVSTNISALREHAQLSVRAAARGAQIHHSEWIRIERGEIDPRLSTLLRIQRSLNLDSVEALLGDTPSRELLQAPKRPRAPKTRR
ncbi:MAG: Helix-turn-helix domain [Gaiellaceae bacterium]|nr:Helix-turn-helix domain [Gaiellaceae bacterium]